MSTYLITLIVPIVLGALFAAATRAKPIETEDGGYVLEYAKVIKGFGLGLPLLTLGGLALLLFYQPINDNGDLYAVVFMFGLFGSFAIYFYVEFFTVKIWVGPSGVRGTSGWRGKREYTWDQISGITYTPMFMWFKISSPDLPPLRISAMITGVDKFQSHYKQNMPEEKWKSADERFSRDEKVRK